MLAALRALGHNQFECARWAPETYDKYKMIRVEALDPSSAQFNTVIRNLMTSDDSNVVRTADRYDYKPRQHLYFRGKWWEIRRVTEIPADIAPQALRLVKGGNMMWALEIGEANGYDVP